MLSPRLKSPQRLLAPCPVWSRAVLLATGISVSVFFADPVSGQEPTEPIEQRVERLEEQVENLRLQLDAEPENAELAEIRRQIEAITREIEALRLGEEVTAKADTIGFGLGPAASKVYRAGQGVSIGGYGEFLFQRFASEREDGSSSGASDQLDVVRAVFYFGYKFDDHFLFNSEVEFEHGSTAEDGSVSVEFAYIDWRFGGLQGSTGLRAGLVLLPMGFINELHEPPTYLGTLRPETERRIIPTTWREVGIGMFGASGDFDWRAFVVNGLDAVGDGPDGGGFSREGLRGGRQKGSKALAEDFAAVGRLDWTGLPGLLVGASGYYGGSGQGAEDPLSLGATITASTFIVEGHAGYRVRGLDLRSLIAVSTVGDVPSLNAARGLAGDESIGERLMGWYVQAGYDVLRKVRTNVQLLPYVRYESINTQDAVPVGFAANPGTDQGLFTVGVQVLPIANIAAKADYTFQSNAAKTGVDQFNISLSYMF